MPRNLALLAGVLVAFAITNPAYASIESEIDELSRRILSAHLDSADSRGAASLGAGLELRTIEISRDAAGNWHARYGQSMHGVPVLGAEAIVHLREDRSLWKIADGLMPDLRIGTEPLVSESQARALVLTGCADCGERADVTLRIHRGAAEHLVWRIAVAEDEAERVWMVDAHTGAVISTWREEGAGARFLPVGEPASLGYGWTEALLQTGALGERFHRPHSAADAGLTFDDDPDHYVERYSGSDERGAAANAGIVRKAFALLAEGGGHHLGGAVEGIGLDAAQAIWREALARHLLPTDSFVRARAATLDAALVLFGEASRERITTAGAWDAVGVEPHVDPSCQIVTNGGFESSAAPWVLAGAASRATGAGAASGTGFLSLGGAVSTTGTARQEIFLPTSPVFGLTFKLHVLSAEGATAVDALVVHLATPGGTVAVSSHSNLNEGTAYVTVGPFPLVASGIVSLVFTATNDSQNPTTFRVDDVSIDCSLANLQPNFVVSAASSHATQTVNENVTFTFDILNDGSLVGRSAELDVTLPEHLSFVSCTTTVGTCSSPAAGLVTAALGEVLPTREATVTVVAHIDCGAPDAEPLAVTGAVSAETSDAHPADDTATASTTPNNPLYLPPPATSNSPVCNLGTLTLTVEDIPGATYSWTGPNGFNSTLREPSIPNVTLDDAGTYSLVATFNGCVSPAGTTLVTIAEDPPAFITPEGATTFCEGGSVVLTANESESYFWSTGEITQSITVDEAGSYTVTVTDGAGCSATSDSQTVTISPQPGTTITADGPLSFCQGGSVTLTAPDGEFWEWSNDAVTQSITVTESGDFSVVVRSAAGCSSTSETKSVTVNPLPSATITASGPLNFCEGGSVTLSAPSLPGATYLWSNEADSQSIVVTESGNFSVTVTSAEGCSRTSSTRTVTVSANAVATITADGPLSFCEGDSVILTASAGASWSWSNGATSRSITVTEGRSYSVTVTTSGGCSATSDPVEVSVTPVSQPTITAGGPTTFCEGNTVTLTASSGATYLWSNGETDQSITVGSPGSYHVTVGNAAGCSATSDEIAVNVTPGPEVTITTDGPTTFCDGGSVTLFANGGADYLWSTGATVPSIIVTEPGTYTVSSTVGSCSSSASIEVNVTGPPVVALSVTGAVEGSAVVLGGTVAASEGARRTAVIDWGDGSAIQSVVIGPGGIFGAEHVYGDDGSYPLVVTVNDPTCPPVTSHGTAVVSNLDPTLVLDESIAAEFTSGPAFVGRSDGTFIGVAEATDPGSDDLTFTWTITPGGDTSSFTYFNNGSSPDPPLSPAGVFPFEAVDEVEFDLTRVEVREVQLSVMDDDGGSDSTTFAFLVTGAARCRENAIVWEREVKQQGSTTYNAAAIDTFLAVLGRASSVFSESVAADTRAQAASVLGGRNRRGSQQFLAELLTAWLNFGAGSLRWWSPVEGPRNFVSVVNEIEALYLGGATDSQLSAATERLAHINGASCQGAGNKDEQEPVPAGSRKRDDRRRGERDGRD
ncbi:MAG TPA: M4 family metallopeptidase [Thermoanaerobaculia bacterium]|nr:M4 family metallopeptidase [Thermoanaerobaculia bacterium]